MDDHLFLMVVSMYSFPLGEVAALSLPIPFAPIFCGVPSRSAVRAISQITAKLV